MKFVQRAFRLQLVPESWKPISNTALHSTPSHVFSMFSSAAPTHQGHITHVTCTCTLLPLQLRLDVQKTLLVQHINVVLPKCSWGCDGLHFQQKQVIQRRIYSASTATFHSTAILEYSSPFKTAFPCQKWVLRWYTMCGGNVYMGESLSGTSHTSKRFCVWIGSTALMYT